MVLIALAMKLLLERGVKVANHINSLDCVMYFGGYFRYIPNN